MRNTASQKNSLAELLAEEPAFKDKGITLDMIQRLINDRAHFIGNAQRQIDQIIQKTRETIDKHSQNADYEPGEIL